MRLVFAGTPEVALPSLDALLASRHEVVAVVTRPDTRSGRGRKEAASPIAARARELELPVLQPDRPGDPVFLDQLQALAPDCCPVVAYGALVPAAALDIPRFGWVNLHFSLLPAWRGAAPVQHALWAGDDLSGAATFQLEEGLDTGPIFGTVTEAIATTDTSGDLLGRLAITGAELLVRTMDGIADGSLVPVPQGGEVTLAPKITTADAEVDWQLPGLAVDRLIRACTPAPGAWTTFRGERLKLGPVSGPADGGEDHLAPGQVRIEGKNRVVVGTGSYPVTLGQVQPPGKRPMAAADWARGVRISDAEVFGE